MRVPAALCAFPPSLPLPSFIHQESCFLPHPIRLGISFLPHKTPIFISNFFLIQFFPWEKLLFARFPKSNRLLLPLIDGLSSMLGPPLTASLLPASLAGLASWSPCYLLLMRTRKTPLPARCCRWIKALGGGKVVNEWDRR